MWWYMFTSLHKIVSTVAKLRLSNIYTHLNCWVRTALLKKEERKKSTLSAKKATTGYRILFFFAIHFASLHLILEKLHVVWRIIHTLVFTNSLTTLQCARFVYIHKIYNVLLKVMLKNTSNYFCIFQLWW